MNNYADDIKRAVSTKDVCQMYGIEVQRGGFARGQDLVLERVDHAAGVPLPAHLGAGVDVGDALVGVGRGRDPRHAQDAPVPADDAVVAHGRADAVDVDLVQRGLDLIQQTER